MLTNVLAASKILASVVLLFHGMFQGQPPYVCIACGAAAGLLLPEAIRSLRGAK